MNIGIIIFVISVVISIISAIRDDNHKKRNKTPKQTQSSKPNGEQPKSKGFLEEIERTFKKLEQEFDDPFGEYTEPEKKTTEKKETPKQKEAQLTQPQIQTATRTENREVKPEKVKKVQDAKPVQTTKQLEDDLMSELEQVRSEIDREHAKRIERTERKAQEIIKDENLSERTKRYRLRQLLQSNQNHEAQPKEKLRFDQDEIVNGIIWSEVLEQPKRL